MEGYFLLLVIYMAKLVPTHRSTHMDNESIDSMGDVGTARYIEECESTQSI